MYSVKLSTPCPDWPFYRQTPGGSGVWGNYEFFENKEIDKCDFWVVYDELLHEETVSCPKEATILILGEPPSVKRYQEAYLKQFAAVVSCHEGLGHPHLIRSHPAQPWHVGRRVKNGVSTEFTKNYDELTSMPAFSKERLISVITSDKTITAGHRKRLEFVRALKDHFGERMDLFGRGICDVEDKWDAIAPYKYHVVLENSSYPDYWTEKLSDSFLAGAFPFYYGCRNLSDYFPEGSYLPIDVHDSAAAIAVIEKALSEGVYEKRRDELALAKDAVLNRYNLYALVAEVCDTLAGTHGNYGNSGAAMVNIKPESAFISGFGRILSAMAKIKERIHG
jgi:hypothetical protein